MEGCFSLQRRPDHDIVDGPGAGAFRKGAQEPILPISVLGSEIGQGEVCETQDEEQGLQLLEGLLGRG